jgi:hypothetical protein
MSKKYRTIPASQVIGKFSSERRARIAAGAQDIIAEQAALSDLRKARRVTQTELAKRLRGKQVYVSRFEKRSDVKVSGLRDYVKGLGGQLDLIVTFPDDEKAYSLKGFARTKRVRAKK